MVADHLSHLVSEITFEGLLIRATIGVPESTIFINLNSSYCRSKATTV